MLPGAGGVKKNKGFVLRTGMNKDVSEPASPCGGFVRSEKRSLTSVAA